MSNFNLNRKAIPTHPYASTNPHLPKIMPILEETDDVLIHTSPTNHTKTALFTKLTGVPRV